MRKILFVAMMLFGCSMNSAEYIIEVIHDSLGITPYLPETDYPIGFVIIEYSQIRDNGTMTKGDPAGARVHYLMSTDEKLDEDFKQAWEDTHSFEEIVYGDLYMDPTEITVTISPDWTGELVGAELIEIEGQEVQYEFISRERETVFMVINFDDINYHIQYSAETENIEDQAKAFAKDIIENN